MVYQKPEEPSMTAPAARSASWSSTTRPSCARPSTRMLGAAPDIEVVGIAADGQEGVEKARDAPARRGHPRRQDAAHGRPRDPASGSWPSARYPVLLLSSLTQEGAEVTLRGLELGAMDFVDKSSVQGP